MAFVPPRSLKLCFLRIAVGTSDGLECLITKGVFLKYFLLGPRVD